MIWGELWDCWCLLILELAVARGYNAIRGCPTAEWVSSVAPEEECVGLYYGKAHPCANEASHVRVCAAPLLCEYPCNATLGCKFIIRGHAIDRVDKRGEILAMVEACSLILVFLLFGMTFKDFAQGGVAIGE